MFLKRSLLAVVEQQQHRADRAQCTGTVSNTRQTLPCSFAPLFSHNHLGGWQGSDSGARFKDEATEAQKGGCHVHTAGSKSEILHALSHSHEATYPTEGSLALLGAVWFSVGVQPQASPSGESHLTSAGHLTDATCPAVPPSPGMPGG